LTYYLSKEKSKPEYEDIQPGERCDVYNYSEITQSGSLDNALKLLYDSIFKAVVDSDSPYVTNNEWAQKMFFEERRDREIGRLTYYWPFQPVNQNSKKAYRFDTVVINKSLIKAIMMNREWLYDIKRHKIILNTVDAGLFCPTDSAYPVRAFGRTYDGEKVYLKNNTGDPIGYGAIKFCDRSDASKGLNQQLYNAEIVWGREMSLPLISTNSGGSKLFSYKPYNYWASDSSPCYIPSFNYAPKLSYCGYITPLKSIFDKPLVEWIWEEARNGSLEVYENSDFDKMGKKLKHEEVMDAGTKIDTVTNENGNYLVVKSTVGPEQLFGLKIKEEIYFNKKTFLFESRIIYAGVLIYNINKNTGKIDENALPEILYWVKFKD
jgi:hypothetical protein